MYKLIFVMALSSLFACGNKSDQSVAKKNEEPKTENVKKEKAKTAWEEFSNDELTIDYPGEWKFQNSDKEKIVFEVFPNRLKDEKGFNDNINLAVQNAPADLTLEKVDLLIEKGNKKLEGYKPLKSNTKKLKGSEILNLEYLATRQGYELKYKQHFIIKNNKLYNLTFSAKPKTYSKRIIKVIRMFNSLDIN